MHCKDSTFKRVGIYTILDNKYLNLSLLGIIFISLIIFVCKAIFEEYQKRQNQEKIHYIGITIADKNNKPTDKLVKYISQDAYSSQTKASISDLNSFLPKVDKLIGMDKRRAITEFWHRVAGLGKLDEAVITTLDLASHDPNPLVARQAELALADLHRLQYRREHGYTEVDMRVELEASLQNAIQKYRQGVDAQARALAVTEVARFKNTEADAILVEAAIDADAIVRYKAIEALWRKAADDPDGRAYMVELLQQAAFDHDAQVAGLAGRAMEDLEQLKQARVSAGFESEDSVPP